jgi:hypothetical protein
MARIDSSRVTISYERDDLLKAHCDSAPWQKLKIQPITDPRRDGLSTSIVQVATPQIAQFTPSA